MTKAIWRTVFNSVAWCAATARSDAPDGTLSLLALVPLSHFLRWSLADLKRSFLSPEGKPLLRDGRYAAP